MSQHEIPPRYRQSLLLTYTDPATEAKFRLYKDQFRPKSALLWLFVVSAAILTYAWDICPGYWSFTYLSPVIVRRPRSQIADLSVRLVILLASLNHVSQFSAVPHWVLCKLYAVLSDFQLVSGVSSDLFVYMCLKSRGETGIFPLEIAGLWAMAYVWELKARKMWESWDVAIREEHQLRSVLDTVSVGLVVTNAQSQQVYANPQAKVSGFSTEDHQRSPGNDSISEVVAKCWKGELHEAVVDLPNKPAGFAVAKGCKISWNAVNSILVALFDVSRFIKILKALQGHCRFVVEEMMTVEWEMMRCYQEGEEGMEFNDLARFHMVKHHLLNALILSGSLTPQPPSPEATLNFRTEVINSVELLSELCESRQLFISLTFEPGIPRILTGNRLLTGQLFTTVLKHCISTINEKGNLAVVVWVAGVQDNTVKLTVHFEFPTNIKAGARSVDMFNSGKCDRESIWTIDKSGLDAFFAGVKSVNGSCQAGLKQVVGQEAAVVTISYQFSMGMKQREVQIATVLPSDIRCTLGIDKFVWDFHPSNLLMQRKIKRNSVHFLEKLPKFHSFTSEITELDTIVERNPSDDLDKITEMSPQLPNEESESMQIEMLSRGVNRHSCDLSSKSCSTTTSPYQETRIVLEKTAPR